MTHFFDTSVLVAAFDGEDVHHGRARPILTGHGVGASMAAHSLAEAFSILTGRRA